MNMQAQEFVTALSTHKTIFETDCHFEEAFDAIEEAFGTKAATAAALEAARSEHTTMFENKYS